MSQRMIWKLPSGVGSGILVEWDCLLNGHRHLLTVLNASSWILYAFSCIGGRRISLCRFPLETSGDFRVH